MTICDMKTWFYDSNLLYCNSVLVLSTMFKNGIIDKKDLAKADKCLAKKYKISKGSLIRIYICNGILSDNVPKQNILCNDKVY